MYFNKKSYIDKFILIGGVSYANHRLADVRGTKKELLHIGRQNKFHLEMKKYSC